MTWNYRVVKHVMDASGEEVTEYGIHEVCYDDDGNPDMVTVNPIAPFGLTLEELRASMERMTRALEEPVLDYEQFNDEMEDIDVDSVEE